MILRWGGRLLLALAGAVVLYAAWAAWAWRDLPAAELDARYGGAQVAAASVDGVSIRYRLDGPVDRSRPVVVLIHSHYLDMGMWDAWLAELAPSFTVLRYDLTGHGLTGPDPAGVYSVDRDVALLSGLLQHLGIGPVALVGSSLGGNIAFTFAARQPERVRALVLVNSGGLKRAQHRSGKDLPRFAGPLLRLVPPAALRRFLRWMAGDDTVVTAALEQRFTDLWRRAGNREAEFERLRQFDAGEPEPLLAAITAPVLVLWGEANPQLPVELAAQFEQKLVSSPRVVRKTYPGAGHLLPLERPRESAADARAFLEGWR